MSSVLLNFPTTFDKEIRKKTENSEDDWLTLSRLSRLEGKVYLLI